MTDASFVVALVAALAAALGGGLVAAAGFLFQRREERRRLLRSALYVLLQVWWPVRRLSMIDPDAAIAQYERLVAEVWHERTGQPFTTVQAPRHVRTLFSEVVHRLALGPHIPQDQDVQTALDHVGAFHPVLAYTLRRIPFGVIIATLNDFSEQAAALVRSDQLYGLQHVHGVSQRLLLQLHVSAIEQDVLALALRCGVWDAFSVWRTVRRARSFNVSAAVGESRHIVEALLDQAIRDEAGPAIAGPASEHTGGTV